VDYTKDHTARALGGHKCCHHGRSLTAVRAARGEFNCNSPRRPSSGLPSRLLRDVSVLQQCARESRRGSTFPNISRGLAPRPAPIARLVAHQPCARSEDRGMVGRTGLEWTRVRFIFVWTGHPVRRRYLL